jgi:membrane-associated phospholipid phosphatase
MDVHQKSADIISYLLSPTTIGFYVIVLFILFSEKTKQMDPSFLPLILAIGLIFLCILPVVGILYFAKIGTIDIWVSERRTRPPFYLVAIFGYLIASILFYSLNAHDFFVLSVAYIGVTITVLFVNFKTKVSSHSAGLTGPFTAVLFVLGPLALFLFIFLPFVIWARLHLKAHTFSQLILGSVIGSLITSATYLVLY